MAIRIHPRVPLELYINKLINGVPHLAIARDLSRQGMFVRRVLEPEAPKGAHLALEFEVPGTDEIIWTQAEVVHRSPSGGLGLRFLDLTPRESRLLDRFVETYPTSLPEELPERWIELS